MNGKNVAGYELYLDGLLQRGGAWVIFMNEGVKICVVFLDNFFAGVIIIYYSWVELKLFD